RRCRIVNRYSIYCYAPEHLVFDLNHVSRVKEAAAGEQPIGNRLRMPINRCHWSQVVDVVMSLFSHSQFSNPTSKSKPHSVCRYTSLICSWIEASSVKP